MENTTDHKYIDKKPSRMQRTMARRMAESKAEIPHFYTSMEIDVTGMLALRRSLKKKGDECPTVNDYFIYGVAQALRATPAMNVQFHDGMIRQFYEPTVGVAIAIESGLVVPMIPNTARLSLEEVRKASADLATRARSKLLVPEDFEGGTFTVSSVGAFGMMQSMPIINPPESAILGIGAARPQVRRVGDELEERMFAICTLAADHRVLDGAIAGAFLGHLKQYIESLAV